MSRVTCVAFPNRRQDVLSGILHEPDPAGARGVCVLLLSPGTKGRVGPHRLYLKIAEPLASLGFHVLRFDYSGLGDSGGMLPERVLVEVYNAIQDGRYVDDTIAAMDWMQRTHGVGRFVASGLCGGSISGLLTAAEDRRIISLLGLGIPVAFDGGEEHWGRYLTKGQLDGLREAYLRKVTKPSAWLRLLSGRSSYDVIWKVVLRAFKARRPAPPPEVHGPEPTQAPVAQTDNTNPKFARSFLSVLASKRPVLLIFSGADRLGWEFEEKFVQRHAEQLRAMQPFYEVHTIDNANHVLGDRAWVREFLDHATRWLDRVHPAREVSA